MSKKAIAVILVFGLAAPGLLGGLSASGSVRMPAAFLEEPLSPASAPRSRAAGPKAPEKKRAFLKRMRDRFARLKPVQKKPEHRWDEAEAILTSKSTMDEIFDREMSEKMEARYRGAVLPLEKDAMNSDHRASTWEMQRYEQSRKDLAEWTMKEVGKTQLKEFLRRQKSESVALEAVAATSGIQEEPKKETQELSEQERIAQAHHLNSSAEEEVIPTRLRAKLNLLKARGQLTFSNPVVITSVEAKAGSGDNLAVELNKDFSDLEMNSRLRYGVDQSLIVLNLNKKITDEVSLDLNSERWTGSKRGSLGEKSKDTAKVLYSISF